MLVTTPKGHVAHITRVLAEMLGRTRRQAMSMSGQHMVEQFMAAPFAQMHRELLQVRAVHFTEYIQASVCVVSPY
jgi:hypothetical protein